MPVLIRANALMRDYRNIGLDSLFESKENPTKAEDQALNKGTEEIR